MKKSFARRALGALQTLYLRALTLARTLSVGAFVHFHAVSVPLSHQGSMEHLAMAIIFSPWKD